MRERKAAWLVVPFLVGGFWACGEDEPSASSSSSGDADAAGVDGSLTSSSSSSTSSGSSGELPDDDPGTPVYPEQHPRILLSNAALRARLQSMLQSNDPAAQRFREMVDGQQGGGNVYAYKPWFSALLYVLTGEERYATYAVQETDSFVASEEALIAGGMA